VVVDDAEVVEAVSGEDEGAEGGFGGVIEAAVEFFGDAVFEGDAGGDGADAVEVGLSIEGFVAEGATVEADAAEAQRMEGVVPGGVEGGEVGVARDLEDLSGVVGVGGIPLAGEALEDVES